MAIRLTVKETDKVLFCGSKWWGDPDMPEAMEYPMTEDYPLTFVCQINCEDIAKFDPEGKLPHEGMLYFFAALDQWLGYESPLENGIGEWPKGHFVVKYAKEINFETFRSCIMVDEDDNPITEPEREIEFSECADDADGIKLLGVPFYEEIRMEYPDMINLLQLDEDDELCMRFYDCGMVNLLMKESDLKFKNWKKTKAYLHSL
ncbi:MAG: DUF1963 domain-containing protein [Bacteroidales bacterium]|nr:DUF1963 domain-containing protein [Bacteroidales bacterium]